MNARPLLNHRLAGNRDGAVLLFLHGFMGSMADWRDVAGELEAEYQCLYLDLPGHGGSRNWEADIAWDMNTTARAVREVLDSLKVSKCSIIGYSMGGRLGLYLALRCRNGFRSLVLVSASAGLRTEKEREVRRAADARLADELRRLPLSEFLTRWYRQPLFAGLNRHSGYPHMLAERLGNDPAALGKSLREMGAGRQPALWGELAGLTLPVLYLAGQGDRKYCRIGAEIVANIPAARLEILPDCGHNAPFENPRDFLRTLKRWLADSTSGDIHS